MSVDPRVYDLAVLFLSDIPSATDDDRTELAEAIQEVCDDFCRDLERGGCCRACGACPGFIGAECDETCDHAKRERA